MFCKLDCIFILVLFVSNLLNIITQLMKSLILMQLYVPHVDQMLAMSQRNEREMSQRNERLAFTKNYGLHELP